MDPGAATVPGSQALPLRSTDFDAALAALYHKALRGMPAKEVLEGVCQHLARLLRLRLVVLARRIDTGAMAIDAASRENALWVELQRIPERWDSGVASRGPAGTALRQGTPVRMAVTDENFAMWRAGAEAELVREVLAVPLRDGDTYVLELYFDGEIPRGAVSGTLTIDGLAALLVSFFDDLRLIGEQGLLARALESAGNGAFITDLEGTIVWSNAAFGALSGYSPDEVRGRNPSILRSGQQGIRYYRDLWATIRAGRVWSGETVDRAKDGNTYTIQQTVSPVAQDGRVTHYLSVHQDIGRQKRAQNRLELASRLSPVSGLLTPAAFNTMAPEVLREMAARPRAFVVISLRGALRAAAEADPELEDIVASVIGKRLRECLPEGALAATLGTFEYVVLLDDPPSLTDWLHRVADALHEPIPYPGEPLALEAHFGAAAFPRDGITVRTLWNRADRQLADQPYRRARRELRN